MTAPQSGSTPLRVRPDGLSWQEVDDEIVVLDLENSRYLSLNGSAGLLWKMLDLGASSIDALTEVLLAEFEVNEHQARDDVTAFVSQCSSLGLLV